MLPFGRPDLEQTRRMRNARHPDLFLDHRGCMECGAGTPYAGIRTPSETASRRDRAGPKTQCRTPSAETRTPSRTASRRDRAEHKTQCRTPSAETRTPSRTASRRNRVGHKTQCRTPSPERRPLLRKSKWKIRSTQNIVFRHPAPPGPRPEFPKGEPGRMPRRGGTVRSDRSRGRGRSRSRGRGRFPPDTLRRHIRGSAAGPRAYTRKTERGIRMHELPSLRFTPAVTTATPVRSPPKRSPRLRRPRSWAQPSL